MNRYTIGKEKLDIIKQDWNFLVILDTCRYDIFKNVYGAYFKDGELKKAISPACWTGGWLSKCFKDYYDNLIYISGNAYCNSKVKMKDGNFMFDAKKHFYKIVDVWDFGWDDKYGQVPPKEINKAFKKTYIRYPQKKFILHYMQPHSPWLSIGGEPQTIKQFKRQIDATFKEKQKQVSTLRQLARKIPPAYWWTLRKYLGIEPKTTEEKYFHDYGRKGMINAYTMELILGLNYVNELVKTTKGKWLITADHGELLGEHGWYGHPRNHAVKKQVEVPWFEVETK